jgi:hypothetical protein
MKTVGNRLGVKGLKVFSIYRTAGLEKIDLNFYCVFYFKKSQTFKKICSIPHLQVAHHWY